MSQEQEDIDMDRLKKACENLSEHFDTVHIFVTREGEEMDDGGKGTMNGSWGSGNWFARKGQITEWVLKEDESTRNGVRDK